MTMKMMKRLLALLAAAVMLFGLSVTSFAAEESKQWTDTAGNYFFATEKEAVQQGHFFGGFGTGREVVIDGCQADDTLTLVGQNLTIMGSQTGGSVYTAGYAVNVQNSTIAGNLCAAGYSISMDKGTSAKAALIACKDFDYSATTDALHVTADKVRIDGIVNGDVDITANDITIGENTKITGTLHITSKEQPAIPEIAEIGGVTFKQVEQKEYTVPETSVQDKVIGKIKGSIYWIVAVALIGLALCIFFPKKLDSAGKLFMDRKAAVLINGAITLLITPVVAILICITVVGIPLGLILLMLYTVSLCIATAFTGASILRNIPKVPGFVLSMIGVILLQILKAIPYLGIVIGIFVSIYTLGVFTVSIKDNMGGNKKKHAKMIEVVEEPSTELIPADNEYE